VTAVGGTRRTLTGPEKVGLLLLALGKDKADGLLRKFDSEELNIIMRSTEVMPTLSTAELEAIVEELNGKVGEGLPFVGRPEDLKRLVSSAITKNRSAFDSAGLSDERQDVWTRLPGLTDDVLYPFLSRQHPQIATYLLHRLGPERATSVLKLFPLAQRNELLCRTLGLRTVQPAAIEALEQSIHREFFAIDKGSADKHIALASILSNFEKTETTESLTYLAGIRPKDAEAIRKMIFKFEDLIKLSGKALTVLMDGVPVERVVIALQGLDANFQQKVVAALSPRARRMAEAELQAGAVAQPKDIAEARRAIVESVLKLAAEGMIDIATTSVIEESGD
jgi:flagellar motor switch protein FliG